jgi:multidrug efflux pump subunit AcrB
MNLTRTALKNPAALAVAVAMVAFFGLYSIKKLPVQLFPDIEQPQMTIQTGWRAASPKEVESELVEPLEDVLQGLPGLETLSANAGPGFAWIGLTFALGTDMQQALIEVISRMNRLPPMPRDADPPVVQLGEGGGGANGALSYFFIQLLPGTPGTIEDYLPMVEELVKPRLESVPGVAGIEINAAGREQLQITFDPYRAAELGVTIPAVAAIAGQANDVSGGQVDVGRRQYMLRFAGRYSPDQLGNLILEWRDGRPIHLGDIASIEVGRSDRRFLAYQNGNPAVSVRVNRQSGANVLKALNDVKAEVEALRDGPLKELGLTMHQSFDASVFIYRAINLVTGNLFIGILLAIGVLWWFLRQARATLLVALAIPVSVLATFVVLNLTGRSLNVISLAGLAFASGMVLDAAIVVLENILRLRGGGMPAEEASAEGTRQVWGALVASTATTVAIFLPVIFLQDVEGQLFADLALTIAIAVVMSLIVAVTVLPTAAKTWLPPAGLEDRHASAWSRMADGIVRLTATPKRRWALILGLMTLPVVGTLLLMPRLDYLPPVKRDAVDAYFSFPPGANTETIDTEIVQVMMDRLEPYMQGTREPALKNYYVLTWPNGGTIGARALDQTQVGELQRIVTEEITAGLPDTQAYVAQGNLFGNFGGARSIDIHLQARDAEALLTAARTGMQLVSEAIPGAQVRPEPGLQLAEPELRVLPRDQRLIEAGWNRAELATVIRALGDGVWVGEHFDGDQRLDVIFRARGWNSPEDLADVPVATPAGTVVPLGELADIQRTVGPSTLRRVDRRRTVTLSVNPPDRMSLEEAMTAIEEQVQPGLRASLPPDGTIIYGGSADRLKVAIGTMAENFAMALLVLFMLMSALFRSIRDSLLVMLCLPLATVGGMAGIRILNLTTFQPLDLLTMIGFIILMGLVVNNAILLVHQTRSAERQGLARELAVRQALGLRLRPIFMSTLTSIFGMLPLVLMPGVGSVIYRGLATVIVGGMSVSTLFTLLLLPSLLRLGETRADRSIAEGPATPEPAGTAA